MSDIMHLAKQRCLVLGGSGFIGTNLCIALRDKVQSLKSFSAHAGGIDGVEYIKGDYLNKNDIDSAICDVDTVFHLISTSTPASSNASPLIDAQQNIVQSLQLLDACRSGNVRRVIFVSSGGTIYGNASTPTPESHPQNPICAYGISKLAIEKYIVLYERLYGITGISLRLSNPYGPHQHSHKQQGVIGTFIRKSLAGEKIEIWGDGSVIRDYIYIDDVIDAMTRSAEYNGKERIFNIGSGIGTSLNEILETLSSLINHEILVNYEASRDLDVSKSVLDCSLASQELSWQASHDLKQGIKKTLDWFSTHQTAAGLT